MDKNDVINFFDSCAEWWDADMIRNENVIKQILDNAGIKKGIDVLDVACGTGVLFPDYLKREANSVTAIDISPKMVEIARKKFPQINVICGDAEAEIFTKKFDCIMVYNSFPHFSNPIKIIEILSQHTVCGGRLSVAHGMSRDDLTKHHKRAEKVSTILPEAENLADIFSKWFDIETVISNSEMYQVVGIRKK